MKKSDRAWSKNWTPCSTDSSTLNTRQLRQGNSGNRQGRNILTAVECRRATAGLLLLGSYDRSVPRSCKGRQGKALTDASPRSSRPHRKIRRFGDGWQRGFSKSSLPVGGGIEANPVAERLSVTPYFEDVGTTCKPKKTAEASAEAAYPLGEPTVLCSRRMKVS